MNKLYLPLLAAFAFSSHFSAAQAVAEDLFPDKNLEAVVRQYVFEKRNNEEPLVEDDVVNISTIKGRGKGIQNLAGLEKCRSLALLDLQDNQIADATPIKDLEMLQSVNLAQNKLQDITPLANLKGLQYLHLAGNEIADVSPLTGLENLRSLYLSGNKITDVAPLKPLTRLWSLYLDGNQISDIQPLAPLTDLSSLDLRSNQVEQLAPLSELTELRYLLLDQNKISDLQVLVEMAQKDIEGEKRFAPFWRIYLQGNPLSDKAKNEQIPKLKELGARVTTD